MVIGSKIKDLVKIPSLHLESQREKCIQCKKCDKVCQMSLAVQGMVESGSMSNMECILCGQCVDSCPKGVIHYSFGLPKKEAVIRISSTGNKFPTNSPPGNNSKKDYINDHSK
ncbi:4Fe-4S binding protein [Candidatus Contubernalis alkaliaceticus]|uniref:4Fe-4S binding protein n=1 Tax=Candidatus Contubernalis alkaliaceticus TaxID=338645 RepID=UPI001F4C492E|nr:4Fe-4S dicluster domain-containing protein [Candidatus Contubernalis alkalaceticus]